MADMFTARVQALRKPAFEAIKAAGEVMPGVLTEDDVPMATDLVQFVMWLRDSTDFFSGPDLDLHYPKADSPEFTEVLAQLALEYTGE